MVLVLALPLFLPPPQGNNHFQTAHPGRCHADEMRCEQYMRKHLENSELKGAPEIIIPEKVMVTKG